MGLIGLSGYNWVKRGYQEQSNSVPAPAIHHQRHSQPASSIRTYGRTSGDRKSLPLLDLSPKIIMFPRG